MKSKRSDRIFSLRLPDELRDDLEELAEENRRSLTSEIIWRIQESIRQERQGKAA